MNVSTYTHMIKQCATIRYSAFYILKLLLGVRRDLAYYVLGIIIIVTKHCNIDKHDDLLVGIACILNLE